MSLNLNTISQFYYVPVIQEANWSGSAPFVIHYVNVYQQLRLSNLIGLQLEMDVAS